MKTRILQITINVILSLFLLSSCVGSIGTQNWEDSSMESTTYGNSPYCAVTYYGSSCIYYDRQACIESASLGSICKPNPYRY